MNTVTFGNKFGGGVALFFQFVEQMFCSFQLSDGFYVFVQFRINKHNFQTHLHEFIYKRKK
jgi:hypothetical protein